MAFKGLQLWPVEGLRLLKGHSSGQLKGYSF